MTMTAIPKKSLDLHAADALREQITSGKIRPGSRMTETKLSQSLGLSRGTVRSALHRLAAEGLVDQTPYTGWQVSELTARDAWELYTLRCSLEGMAARLSAKRSGDHQQVSLLRALEMLRLACVSNDRDAVTAADVDLHAAIVVASGHRRLLGQYNWVELQVRTIVSSSNALAGSFTEIFEQHCPIVTAIVDGDGDRAEAAVRWHLLTEGKSLVDHLSANHASGRSKRGDHTEIQWGQR